MRIILDGKELDFKLPEKEVKVRDVVDEVEQFLFSVGQIPTALTIDGKVLQQEELNQREDEFVKGTETFDFGTINIFEWVENHLEGAEQANQKLKEQLQNFADEIHQSDKTVNPEALVDEIDHFFQFWIRMYGLINEQFEGITFDGKAFGDFLESMRQMLEEVLAAMEEEDWVLAADLLQYEMAPQLDAMDEALPNLVNKVQELAVKEREATESKAEVE